MLNFGPVTEFPRGHQHSWKKYVFGNNRWTKFYLAWADPLTAAFLVCWGSRSCFQARAATAFPSRSWEQRPLPEASHGSTCPKSPSPKGHPSPVSTLWWVSKENPEEKRKYGALWTKAAGTTNSVIRKQIPEMGCGRPGGRQGAWRAWQLVPPGRALRFPTQVPPADGTQPSARWQRRLMNKRFPCTVCASSHF